MTATFLLSRLHGAYPHGLGWRAHCPAHGSLNTSLSIWDSDYGPIVKCSSGCSREEILLALGLAESDLSSDGAADNGDSDKQRRQEAELVLASARGSITDRTDEKLDDELNRIADAHNILARTSAASQCDGAPRLAEMVKTPGSPGIAERAFGGAVSKHLVFLAHLVRIGATTRHERVQPAQLPW